MSLSQLTAQAAWAQSYGYILISCIKVTGEIVFCSVFRNLDELAKRSTKRKEKEEKRQRQKEQQIWWENKIRAIQKEKAEVDNSLLLAHSLSLWPFSLRTCLCDSWPVSQQKQCCENNLMDNNSRPEDEFCGTSKTFTSAHVN